ncbi:MAG: prepilin-type N-terminal cleavage/methylation domain-containing protein [Geminicoccales bacterium]
MRRCRRTSGGFTLLELMVAMTLLGLLMTALFGGLRLGARVWEVSDRVFDDESRILTTQRFLRDRLEQTFPARHRDDDGSGPIVFSGDRTSLRFASTMPDSLGPGPFIMELVLEHGPHQEAAQDLTLRWRTIGTGENDAGNAADQRVLISDLAIIDFAYFGSKDDARSPPGWHSTWQDQETLPDLIRLDFGAGEGAVADWPPLIVSLMVNAWHDPTF